MLEVVPQLGSDGATGSTAEAHADVRGIRDLEDMVRREAAEFRRLIACERAEREAHHLFVLERLGEDKIASVTRQHALVKSVNALEKHMFQDSSFLLEANVSEPSCSISARTCVLHPMPEEVPSMSEEWRERLNALSTKIATASELGVATISALEEKVLEDINVMKAKYSLVEKHVCQLRRDIDGLCGDADKAQRNANPNGSALRRSFALPSSPVREAAITTAQMFQEAVAQPSISLRHVASPCTASACRIEREYSSPCLHTRQQHQPQAQTQTRTQAQTAPQTQVHVPHPLQQHQPMFCQTRCSIRASSPRSIRAPSAPQQNASLCNSPCSQNRAVQRRPASPARF